MVDPRAYKDKKLVSLNQAIFGPLSPILCSDKPESGRKNPVFSFVIGW